MALSRAWRSPTDSHNYWSMVRSLPSNPVSTCRKPSHSNLRPADSPQNDQRLGNWTNSSTNAIEISNSVNTNCDNERKNKIEQVGCKKVSDNAFRETNGKQIGRCGGFRDIQRNEGINCILDHNNDASDARLKQLCETDCLNYGFSNDQQHGDERGSLTHDYANNWKVPGENDSEQVRNKQGCPFEECNCQMNELRLDKQHGFNSESRLTQTHGYDKVFQTCQNDVTRRHSDVSERSSYSTDSDEEDDYDLVDWNSEVNESQVPNSHPDAIIGEFATPLTSPTFDLGALNGYYTAPNSLSSTPEVEGFCLVDKPLSNFTFNTADLLDSTKYAVNKTQGRKEDFVEVTKEPNKPPGFAEVSTNANAICANNKSETSVLETFVESVSSSLGEIEESSCPKEGTETEQKQIPKPAAPSESPYTQMPPFISVECIQYEADPNTGEVRSVGKGSFGQVFKARFADPAYHHLRIVVKEFDDEFTNRHEIIEEAQRLLYLRDTGYVPMCYGLLCLGDPKKPTYGIVQEYVGSGLTLEQLLWDQYDLPFITWLLIAAQCCEGLARFHEKRILLNDIKSNNIILELLEPTVQIKYIDFGLATDMRGKKYKNTKSLEDFVYLAPEVRKCGGTTNMASDIYSLGYLIKQLYKSSGIQELKFVAGLCMDLNPSVRIPVRAARSLLHDHLIHLGCFHGNGYDVW